MNEWEWQLLEDSNPVDSVQCQGGRARRGDRVRLRPRSGGDIFDMALAGMTATIESIEQDYEGNLHVCVVVDQDPGRDIGLMRQPGHRFFFTPTELEVLNLGNFLPSEVSSKKILVAGVGNIFLGDDGFGVEVASRLAKYSFPTGVRVTDFGIRGFDLSYALMEGYESTILIDIYPGDAPPGTLSVIEPDLSEINTPERGTAFMEPHGMNPVNVLRMASALGAKLQRILLVGCVPATLGPEEGQMGLSEPVSAAVEDAAKLVEVLVSRILQGDWPGKK
jgi:hydrogenase maturation protease